MIPEPRQPGRHRRRAAPSRDRLSAAAAALDADQLRHLAALLIERDPRLADALIASVVESTPPPTAPRMIP